MTEDNIRRAVREAEAFVAAAKRVLASMKESATFAPGRETGALRRRSMDLTRALADMRNPWGKP